MPVPDFPRQPPASPAAAWFARSAGQVLIASEAGLVRDAARERPGYPGLWLLPVHADSDAVLDQAMLRLHAQGDRFAGDLQCDQRLPLASDSCGVVVVQHLADISTQPMHLLEECARVLVAGGRLWLLALNPLAPYRLRWRAQGPRAAEPVTWRRRLRAAGLAPESVSRGIGPIWATAFDDHLQEGTGLRAAFLLRAEKRRVPLTPVRTRPELRLQPGLPAA